MKITLAALVAAAALLLPVAASAFPYGPVVVASPYQPARVVCDYFGRCHRVWRRPYLVAPQAYVAPGYGVAPLYGPAYAPAYAPTVVIAPAYGYGRRGY